MSQHQMQQFAREISALSRRDDLEGLRAVRQRAEAEGIVRFEGDVLFPAFITAVTDGNIEIVRELREGFGLTYEDARGNEQEALRVVASFGDVEMLNELRRGFGFDIDDVREGEILTVAASTGSVDFLRALREFFGLTVEDATAGDNAAVVSAASGGNVEFLRELRVMFDLGYESASDQDNEALIGAASEGHVKVLKELRDGYHLTSENARARDNQAFIEAAENNKIDAMKFLAFGFQLTTQDVSARNNFALRNAVRNRKPAIVHFIRRFVTMSEEQRQREYHLTTVQDDPEEEEQRPRQFEETLTAPIDFNINPPFVVDLDIETSTCFDLIEFDIVDAKRYLDLDNDNIIIINVPAQRALCYSKENLRTASADTEIQFVECLGEIDEDGNRGLNYIRADAKIYVRIPADESGMNAFIPLENIREAVSSRERIFCLVPLMMALPPPDEEEEEADDRRGLPLQREQQASLSHTITVNNLRGRERNFVSANHCQRGTNILLYKFVKCRFRDFYRAPSWTLQR